MMRKLFAPLGAADANANPALNRDAAPRPR